MRELGITYLPFISMINCTIPSVSRGTFGGWEQYGGPQLSRHYKLNVRWPTRYWRRNIAFFANSCLGYDVEKQRQRFEYMPEIFRLSVNVLCHLIICSTVAILT